MKYFIFVFALVLQKPDSSHNNTKDGLAINGYDVVSYFQGAPEKGKKNINASHASITFYFSSEKNKQQFLENPDQYVPAYGGWCAYAMGVNGEKVKIDPETFKIIDDRLFLFYNFWGNNTLKSWNEDESALKMKADNYWEQIISSNN